MRRSPDYATKDFVWRVTVGTTIATAVLSVAIATMVIIAFQIGLEAAR